MLTPEQVKKQFQDRGESIADWARQHNFKPHQVYRLLGGYDVGMRGKAHQISVKLGLKPAPDQPTA